MVAELFQKILFQSGLRAGSMFSSLTATQALQEGSVKFAGRLAGITGSAVKGGPPVDYLCVGSTVEVEIKNQWVPATIKRIGDNKAQKKPRKPKKKMMTDEEDDDEKEEEDDDDEEDEVTCEVRYSDGKEETNLVMSRIRLVKGNGGVLFLGKLTTQLFYSRSFMFTVDPTVHVKNAVVFITALSYFIVAPLVNADNQILLLH